MLYVGIEQHMCLARFALTSHPRDCLGSGSGAFTSGAKDSPPMNLLPCHFAWSRRNLLSRNVTVKQKLVARCSLTQCSCIGKDAKWTRSRQPKTL